MISQKQPPFFPPGPAQAGPFSFTSAKDKTVFIACIDRNPLSYDSFVAEYYIVSMCMMDLIKELEMAKMIIEELNELRGMLRWILNKKLLSELVELAELIDKSYVENYSRIVENSEFGKDCGYAKKAEKLFKAFGDKPIRSKIEQIYKVYIEER